MTLGREACIDNATAHCVHSHSDQKFSHNCMTTSLLPSGEATPALVLRILLDLMQASESDTARIQAAKILLERMSPSQDDDARRREEDERNTAVAEARCLLAELAAELAVAKSAGLHEPPALDQDRTIGTDHTADATT